jgi:hypothetical protein
MAFNGMDGRLEAWLDIPYIKSMQVDQAELHAAEMDQADDGEMGHEPVIVHKLWKDFDTVIVDSERGGHGGGDKRLHDQIFINPEKKDPFDRTAGIRDGAMSILIGIAARNSIESGKPVRIGELTNLEPRAERMI